MIFEAYLVQDFHISSGPLRDLMVAAQPPVGVGPLGIAAPQPERSAF